MTERTPLSKFPLGFTAKVKARRLQRKLWWSAKRNPSRRFHALYDRMSTGPILQEAWRRVRMNKGTAGVDKETLSAVEARGVDVFLGEIQKTLWEGEYRPQPVRRVEIPKKSGGVRPLGIPTVKDRVVQMAATLVLTPIFEADFRECSFGYRPKRSAQGALERIRETANHGKNVVVDADIRSFFTRIDHELVLKLVQKRVSDRRIHKLIRQWLKSGVMEDGTYRETEEGTPQGGVISPLLSNVVLNELDRIWEVRWSEWGVLTRYCDDFVIQCRSLKQAKIILEKVKAILRGLKLELHPEKTRVVDLDEGKEGFEFLGHCMRKKRSRRWWGKYYLHRWPTPTSMNAVRERVRNIACRARFGVKSVKDLVPEINRVLIGWGNYYRGGNASESFQKMDSYVRYRLSVFDNKRRNRQRTHLLKNNQRGFYKAMGLHSLSGTVRYLKPPRERVNATIEGFR